MKLHAIRDLNAQDDLGGLGPRVTPAPTPAPAPVPIGNGFVRHPDGTLSTDIPPPAGPATPPIWPFPTQPVIDTTTEEPGAHGFLRGAHPAELVMLAAFVTWLVY